jgi:hypothetical protein
MAIIKSEVMKNFYIMSSILISAIFIILYTSSYSSKTTTNQCVIDYELYYSISFLTDGEVFEINDKTYFYRLLFCQSEESYSMHIETVEIIDDGKVNLIKRVNVSKSIGFDYINEPIQFLDWISTNSFKAKINGEDNIFKIDEILKNKNSL